MDEPFNEKIKTGYRIKSILIGDKNVGKTTLVNHYTNNKAIQEYQETTGIETYKASAKIEEKDFIIKIIDTPSNKQFLYIIKEECKNAHYALIIFDITNRDSF